MVHAGVVRPLPQQVARAPALVAAAAIALLLAQVAVSRGALNPDGVSYLDLARALHAGDWTSFVQGYWSPLYPALIALLPGSAATDPVTVLAWTHIINGLAAIAAVLLLWRWGRITGRPLFAVAALAAFMLASTGSPRIEAVTPDVLLLAVMVALGWELLAHRGTRWALTGLWLGLAFLAKTSAWPWLLVGVPIRLWGASTAEGRRAVWNSSAVAGLIVLLWTVPLSIESGHPTFGSAGRLNYCWYLESCDSRSPDTHLGDHRAYRVATPPGIGPVRWAEFAASDRWTYAPWSDPTAWDAGVITRNSRPPTLIDALDHWAREASATFGEWLFPLLLGVLVPWVLIAWDPAHPHHIPRPDRNGAAVLLLGLLGVLQFVLIHSEPRLVAPFAMLGALALLHGVDPEAGSVRPRRRVLAGAVVVACVLAAGFYGYLRLRDGISSSGRIERVLTSIASTRASLAARGIPGTRIVVIGPAIPAEAAAYMSGVRIVAQVLPGSANALFAQPPSRRDALLDSLFAGKADVAWLTSRDGSVGIVELSTP